MTGLSVTSLAKPRGGSFSREAPPPFPLQLVEEQAGSRIERFGGRRVSRTLTQRVYTSGSKGGRVETRNAGLCETASLGQPRSKNLLLHTSATSLPSLDVLEPRVVSTMDCVLHSLWPAVCHKHSFFVHKVPCSQKPLFPTCGPITLNSPYINCRHDKLEDMEETIAHEWVPGP